MTQGFDEWYREAGYLGDNQNKRAKIGFEAGAASRQAEIDELQNRIDEALKEISGGIYGKRHIKHIVEILKGEQN